MNAARKSLRQDGACSIQGTTQSCFPRPHNRYHNPALISHQHSKLLGIIDSASAARTQCPGVDRIRPDRGD